MVPGELELNMSGQPVARTAVNTNTAARQAA
jgi:hypothetical protein